MIDQMAQAWLDSVERKDAAIMQLSSEAAMLRAENERLRAALERYGEHETGCVMGDRCNCGLLAALRSDRTP